jgi:hypothetical protein
MKLHLFAVAAAALLGACGGSATADLYLLDAPPDNLKAVNIYVTSMAVHVNDVDKGESETDAAIDDDGKWQTLPVGKSIDLVQHEGESAALLLGQLDLPDGKITQIRLVVDVTQPNTVVRADDSTCNLDMSKVEVKGIKISHVFKAFDVKKNNKAQVWVDVDLHDSLKAAGGCYQLEPKIKLIKVKIDGTEKAL